MPDLKPEGPAEFGSEVRSQAFEVAVVSVLKALIEYQKQVASRFDDPANPTVDPDIVADGIPLQQSVPGQLWIRCDAETG